MKAPTNIRELRQFLGMINHLSKFSPFLADQTKPLRDLLSSKNHWIWGDQQAKAFTEIKNALGPVKFWVFTIPVTQQLCLWMPPHLDWGQF